MATFIGGREGTLRASAARSILRRFSASERPAAGHRAGRCRTSPSQGSRSKESSHGPKHKTYVVSPRVSISGRRGEGAPSMRTRRGPIGATAADRDPGRDHIHILFDIMTKPFGAIPLRRDGSAAAGAVPGRHLRAPSGPEACEGARARTRYGAILSSPDGSWMS